MSLLQKGDTVGFVATSSGLEGRDIAPAIQYFENQLGLKVRLAPNLNKAYRYMAGTDVERAAALVAMYQDPEIKALFSIRGAGGSARMLDYLDYSLIAKNPKPLFGLSDVTTVQNAVVAKTGVPAYTGFLPVYDVRNNTVDPALATALCQILFEDEHQIVSGTSLISGTAEGSLIGGCLSSFLYLAGTTYMPDLAGKILLIEDTDEKTYKIDLMLNQLKQQKNFDKLKGIIIGHFSECIVIDEFDGDIDACIKDFTAGLHIPVITDFAYGHFPSRHIVPLGIKARMAATPNKCTLNW